MLEQFLYDAQPFLESFSIVLFILGIAILFIVMIGSW
jgi:hypothetical protein